MKIQTFVNFLEKNQFYGMLQLFGVCEFRVVGDNSGIPVATVAVSGGRPIIMVNKRLESTTNNTINFVLLHEMSHIVQLANRSIKDVMTGQKLYAKILNVAMDIAVHEQIRKLFNEKDFKAVLQEIALMFNQFEESCPKKEEKKPKKTKSKDEPAICLRENIIPASVKEQSWDYYYRFLLSQAKSGPDGEPDLNGIPDSMDGHDLNDMSKEDLEELRDRVTKAFEKGHIMANQRGTSLGDSIFQPSKVSISKQMQSLLNKVKVVCETLVNKRARDYSYGVYNKILDTDSLPGIYSPQTVEKTTVLILDTSGSMWEDAHLNQMFAGLEYLRKKHNVIPFCCDVEVHEITERNQLVGGGGTILDNNSLDKVLKHEKLKDIKQKVDVIYITDGRVDLVPLKTHPKVRPHVVIFNN